MYVSFKYTEWYFFLFFYTAEQLYLEVERIPIAEHIGINEFYPVSLPDNLL